MPVDTVVLFYIFAAFIVGVFIGTITARASSGRGNLRSGITSGVQTADLTRLEKKVDQLISHIQDSSPSVSGKLVSTKHSVSINNRDIDIPPEVMAYLPGKKIEAIKKLRESTGLGLAESKNVIDTICLSLDIK